MGQNTDRAENPQAEPTKPKGCCSVHKAKPAADALRSPQPPVAKSGGSCCSNN
jgi:hypothetical protein